MSALFCHGLFVATLGPPGSVPLGLSMTTLCNCPPLGSLLFDRCSSRLLLDIGFIASSASLPRTLCSTYALSVLSCGVLFLFHIHTTFCSVHVVPSTLPMCVSPGSSLHEVKSSPYELHVYNLARNWHDLPTAVRVPNSRNSLRMALCHP